jgi:putative PIN family toxin of toxin-antitoxin system
MPRAVLDTTILVSAFLKPVHGGASFDLLTLARNSAYELYLAQAILEETARVLLASARIRRRYAYLDADVTKYCLELARLGTVVARLPRVRAVRDPTDDVILACAVAAKADYLVSRDDDLLSLETYGSIRIVAPETFLHLLRASDKG